MSENNNALWIGTLSSDFIHWRFQFRCRLSRFLCIIRDCWWSVTSQLPPLFLPCALLSLFTVLPSLLCFGSNSNLIGRPYANVVAGDEKGGHHQEGEEGIGCIAYRRQGCKPALSSALVLPSQDPSSFLHDSLLQSPHLSQCLSGNVQDSLIFAYF